jgi:hypothetical protein
MTSMRGTPSGRLLAVAVACIALVAALLIWSQRTSDPRSAVVADSASGEGWQTIEYEGVRIDIPSLWDRVDTSSCEFQFERWAQPDLPACGVEGGVAFYASATFDPAHRPGVRRTTEDGAATWGGYVYAGDFAVYISDGDREVVREVLDSARVTAG